MFYSTRHFKYNILGLIMRNSGRFHTLFGIIFSILLFFCLTTIIYSQQITLSGYVKDKTTQKAVEGAAIEITDLNTGKVYTTQSYSLGNWSINITVGINELNEKPSEIDLNQNYPNPFNPSTKIGFNIAREGNVNLIVHNILGQQVDKKSFYLTPGGYSIDWYSKGSSGVLFYTIEAGKSKITRKMVQIDGGNGGWGALSKLNDAGTAIQNKLSKTSKTSFKVKVSKLEYMPDSAVSDPDKTVNFNIETVHNNAFVIDLHNDVLETTEGETYNWGERHTVHHTDIPRLIDGGLDAQIFAIWISQGTDTNYFNRGMNFYSTFSTQVALNSDKIGQAKNETEITSLNAAGKIAGIIGVEGGHTIQNSIDKLKSFYNIGARYLTITWNNSTDWAVSNSDSRSKTVGLSDFGKQVIRTMDTLGMLVDVAHTGIKTISDILTVTKNPIIDSHCGVYNLRAHTRNLTDDQIKAIAAGGGVMGVVFYPSFIVTSGKCTIDDVVKHIDYIKNLVGVDYIAIGSDFDGIETVPVGLEDVSKFPNLTQALLKKGYSVQDVRKILGENFMRVFRKVCK
jgi:membrane dipeptidase